MEYAIQRPLSKTKSCHPLLVHLHGFGENKAKHRHKIFTNGPLGRYTSIPSLHQFVVVAPYCSSDRWWKCDEIMDFIKHIIRTENVDITRVYLSGISMGGYGVWAMLSQYPNCFAAAIPICGGGNPFKRLSVLFPLRWSEFNYTNLAKNTHTAVWAFHGTIDIIVPSGESRISINLLQNNGNTDARITMIPWKGHWIWNTVFARTDVYDWLLSKHIAWDVARETPFYSRHLISRVRMERKYTVINTKTH